MENTKNEKQCDIHVVSGSLPRPKTIGELFELVYSGIECEVRRENKEIVSMKIAELQILSKGKNFSVKNSNNDGYVIFYT